MPPCHLHEAFNSISKTFKIGTQRETGNLACPGLPQGCGATDAPGRPRPGGSLQYSAFKIEDKTHENQ